MSEYPQYQPPQPYPPPNPGVQPPKNRHVLRWTLVGVAVLAVAIGVGAATSSPSKHTATKPAHVAATSSAPATVQPPIIEPATPYVVPTKADFEVTLKILTKDCFGTAGCNVTYRPILAQHQPAGSFDPSITYDVTYTVRGGDDGAQTDTLYVTGDVHEAPNDGMAQTGSAGAKLTAVVTAVEAE